MSLESCLEFLIAARDHTAILARYNGRNLSQLLFHARNDGYDFTAEDVAELVGRLEASVILNKDKDPFDGTSRLWREMWGKRHLDYLVTHVVTRHTDEELRALIAARESGGA